MTDLGLMKLYMAIFVGEVPIRYFLTLYAYLLISCV